MSEHQHEAWQIRQSPSGGYYCVACGEKVMEDGGCVVISNPVVLL